LAADLVAAAVFAGALVVLVALFVAALLVAVDFFAAVFRAGDVFAAVFVAAGTGASWSRSPAHSRYFHEFADGRCGRPRI
jgi:hypothetical protein